MKISPILLAAAAAAMLCSCSASKKAASATDGAAKFPVIDQKGKIAIVAHRGFWKCEQGGNSQNSIAALKAAQDNGFWGCECDIHLTKDGVIIVNHDNDIAGKKITSHNYADFDNDLLPNGEKRPKFEDFLLQAKKCKTTVLVIEFKTQQDDEHGDLLVKKTTDMLKKYGMYDPSRVAFIAFSRHICQTVAREHPQFINQYLSGKVPPAEMAAEGINGLDYHYSNFQLWPEFVKDARDRGMSTNAWTVDKQAPVQEMIDLGVDAITTNEPLMVRELLGDKEFKK